MVRNVPALKSESAEADAQLIANVWKTRGKEAAVLSMFMCTWLGDHVRWEQIALGERARFLATGT